jgi:hypothetical protein
MDIIALLIGLVLFGACIAYISLPFRKRQAVAANLSKASLQPEAQRETVLAALRDLDFDYKTGKVSDEDYQPLRTQLMMEAAQYIEAEEKEEHQLEDLIRARRTMQLQSHLKCQHCDSPIQADQHFCSKCGAAVNNEKCPFCGKYIGVDDLFCPSCGSKIQIHIKALAQS